MLLTDNIYPWQTHLLMVCLPLANIKWRVITFERLLIFLI